MRLRLQTDGWAEAGGSGCADAVFHVFDGLHREWRVRQPDASPFAQGVQKSSSSESNSCILFMWLDGVSLHACPSFQVPFDWKSADTEHGLAKLGQDSLRGLISPLFLLVTFFSVCRNEQPSRTSLYLYEGESIYKSYVSANRRSFHHSCRRTREAVLPFSFGSKLEMLTFSFQIRKRANFSCNCHEAYNMSRIRSRKNQPRQRFLVLIYKLIFFFAFFFGYGWFAIESALSNSWLAS